MFSLMVIGVSPVAAAIDQLATVLPPDATLEDCRAASYGPPLTLAFTTTTATAMKGDAFLQGTGEPFSCASFTVMLPGRSTWNCAKS